MDGTPLPVHQLKNNATDHLSVQSVAKVSKLFYNE